MGNFRRWPCFYLGEGGYGVVVEARMGMGEHIDSLKDYKVKPFYRIKKGLNCLIYTSNGRTYTTSVGVSA